MNSVPAKHSDSDSETQIAESAGQAHGEILGDKGGRDSRPMIVAQMWSAPLPPPDSFNKYPESDRDRIMTMAEEERRERSAERGKKTEAEIEYDKAGQNKSFIVLVLAILVSAGLAALGHPHGLWLALTGLLPALESLLGKLKELFGKNRNEHSD